MEFEEFARQFRARTAQRMLDFEAALARAQQRMERATGPGGHASTQAGQEKIPETSRRSRHAPGPGQVQGVLRRN